LAGHLQKIGVQDEKGRAVTMIAAIALILGWVAAAPEGPEGPGPRDLPISLGEESPLRPAPIEAAAAPDPETEFSLGPAGGYLHARGADRGTWFAGGQARLHFLKYLAAEASITFHENRYQGGDARVTQYPVQVSGMLYPIPEGQFRPYIVAGGGWYYTRVTYTGTLSGISNQTEHVFGGHAGAGLELRLSGTSSLDADIRYIFLNPTNTQVKSGDFNYWQVTFGVNFFF
jgi:hypothetical protein